MALGPGFEWFVAWRHLRDPERRSRRTLLVGLAALAAGAAVLMLMRLVPSLFTIRLGSAGEFFSSRPTVLAENLKVAAIITAAVGLALSILGALFASFTVFTAISIFGVFLGTGAPIIALSVMSGFEADLKSKIRATKADIVVSIDGDHPFTDWEAIEDKLKSVDGVVASMAYLEGEVIVKHISNPAGMGIILRGIDPRRAPQVLDLGRTLIEGKVEYLQHPAEIPADDPDLFRPGDLDGADAGGKDHGKGKEAPRGTGRPVLPGILLGDELYARTLRVYMGSDVDVACPMCGVGPTGPVPKMRPFRVAGHFYTGMYEFDSKLAYAALGDVQKFMGTPGEITGIEIRTRDPDRAPEIASAIAARLGPGYEVRSWEELNRSLFMALKLEKIAMFVVLTFIALVASFSIVSNLIMLVTEKGREIAILKSMGARDGAILRVFIAEGLYIGLLGLALGLALGIGTCLLIARYGLPLDPDVYYIQKLPVVMRGGEIASVALAALGLCCLATLYPAYLASRLRPVAGLRYE
ncbi:MAG TPA: FtsX-like permease family protein [Polyangia bacterium]|nr:FtsX-like permease family protein [Polyangia bacterium]